MLHLLLIFCFIALLPWCKEIQKKIKIHRKELNKRRKKKRFTLTWHCLEVLHCPPTHTELTWHATMGTCRIKVWTDRVSAHRPPLLIYNSYPEGVMNFLIWNLTFKYFYHCTGTSFPTLYIHFQPETESLTPSVEI